MPAHSGDSPHRSQNMPRSPLHAFRRLPLQPTRFHPLPVLHAANPAFQNRNPISPPWARFEFGLFRLCYRLSLCPLGGKLRNIGSTCLHACAPCSQERCRYAASACSSASPDTTQSAVISTIMHNHAAANQPSHHPFPSLLRLPSHRACYAKLYKRCNEKFL